VFSKLCRSRSGRRIDQAQRPKGAPQRCARGLHELHRLDALLDSRSSDAALRHHRRTVVRAAALAADGIYRRQRSGQLRGFSR
jgi:hypothetical protein